MDQDEKTTPTPGTGHEKLRAFADETDAGPLTFRSLKLLLTELLDERDDLASRAAVYADQVEAAGRLSKWIVENVPGDQYVAGEKAIDVAIRLLENRKGLIDSSEENECLRAQLSATREAAGVALGRVLLRGESLVEAIRELGRRSLGTEAERKLALFEVIRKNMIARVHEAGFCEIEVEVQADADIWPIAVRGVPEVDGDNYVQLIPRDGEPSEWFTFAGEYPTVIGVRGPVAEPEGLLSCVRAAMQEFGVPGWGREQANSADAVRYLGEKLHNLLAMIHGYRGRVREVGLELATSEAVTIVAEWAAVRDAVEDRRMARRVRQVESDNRTLIEENKRLREQWSSLPTERAKTVGVGLIAAERDRQLQKWSADHDADHGTGELAVRAAELAVAGTDAYVEQGEFELDAWGLCTKHRGDRVRQLTIAGALVAAEIDRLTAVTGEAKTGDPATEAPRDLGRGARGRGTMRAAERSAFDQAAIAADQATADLAKFDAKYFGRGSWKSAIGTIIDRAGSVGMLALAAASGVDEREIRAAVANADWFASHESTAAQELDRLGKWVEEHVRPRSMWATEDTAVDVAVREILGAEARRTIWRGFPEDREALGFERVTRWMREHAEELAREVAIPPAAHAEPAPLPASQAIGRVRRVSVGYESHPRSVSYTDGDGTMLEITYCDGSMLVTISDGGDDGSTIDVPADDFALLLPEVVDAPPIPMLLTCPACSERHIDAGEHATTPHKTHACQSCGMVWRPAQVATVGVQFLPGCKDGDA